VLSLVAEDLLRKPSPDAMFVPVRLITAGLMLAALSALVWLRSREHRTSGTMFYLAVLDEGWKDRRQAAAISAGADHMAFRSLSRWVDFTHRITTSGVIDVHDIASEVGAALEELVNTDTSDTGYTVAPNLAWPMALSVGAYLPALPGMRVAELDDNGAAQVYPLAALPATTTVHRPTPSETPGRVGVWLAFTEAAQRFTPTGFTEFGVTETHVITYPDGPPTDDNPAPTFTDATMAPMATELAEHLIRIKKAAGDRELVVVAMIPKSVAFALGWHLAQHEGRFFADTHLMHHIHGRGLVPMRVRESQPTHAPQPTAAADA
jgi:hypothetical protein